MDQDIQHRALACINCPSEISKKNTGNPPATKQMKYGIRKAPPPFL